MRNRFSCAAQRIFLTDPVVEVIDRYSDRYRAQLYRLEIEELREVSAPILYEPWSELEARLIEDYFDELDWLEESLTVNETGLPEDYL